MGAKFASGQQPRQLRDAAHAARADSRPLADGGDERLDGGQRRPVSPGQDQRVARVFAGQHRGDVEAVRQDRRHVLAAVHGEVDLAAQQRVLDFLHEQPLAADLGERRLLQPIAGRLDDDDLAGRAARCPTRRRGRARLPEGELAAAGAETELVHAGYRLPAPAARRGASFGPVSAAGASSASSANRRVSASA